MEISPVKQYLRENVSKFELARKCGRDRWFYLYNKKGNYFGEYNFLSLLGSDFLGIAKSLSTTRIFDEKTNPIMGEDTWMGKTYAIVKDKTKDLCLRAIPHTITTMTTFLDFTNDKFKTIEHKSVLQNKLVRLKKDDEDFIYSYVNISYEELKEKPIYEQKIEVVREGLISEAKKEIDSRALGDKTNWGIPFIFW